MAFHAKDGWHFERNEDASVTISLKVYYGDLVDTRQEFTLDAWTWASVVATVSAEGENWQTWHDALVRQEGPPA